MAFISLTANADSLWEKTKSVTEGAVDTAGEVTDSIVDTVSDDSTPDQARSEIDQMASATLDRLLEESSTAKKQFDESIAYAVFDTRQFSFLITTGFGSGVAVDKASRTRTYMKMATGGVNVGAGAEFFQVVFLFPDQKTFNAFITEGWSAGSEAAAVGGEKGLGTGLRLDNGVIVHELTETGLVLSITLTGTRYWKDDELNK